MNAWNFYTVVVCASFGFAATNPEINTNVKLRIIITAVFIAFVIYNRNVIYNFQQRTIALWQHIYVYATVKATMDNNQSCPSESAKAHHKTLGDYVRVMKPMSSYKKISMHLAFNMVAMIIIWLLLLFRKKQVATEKPANEAI